MGRGGIGSVSQSKSRERDDAAVVRVDVGGMVWMVDCAGAGVLGG